jgi:hypothetical protein
MTRPNSDDARLFRALTWLVTALVAVPLLSPGWLPFSDLGEHAAAMGSLARYDDASYRIAEHYTIAWTTSQYMLAHIAGAALVKLTGSAGIAVKILLVGLVVAWVQSSRVLLRAFGGDERLAIFAALLFWNRALGLGFLPYIASLPALFVTFAWFVEGFDRPLFSSRREVALAFAAVVVFYTHASAFTLLAALVVAHVAWRAFRERAPWRVFFRVAWLAPAAVLAAVWVARGRFAMHGQTIHRGEEIGTMAPLRAMKVAPLWAHDIWTSHVDEIIGLIFWTLFVAVLVASRREGDRRTGAVLPFVVVLVIYLVTPFRVGTGFLLNVRMAPVLALFALVALPKLRGRVRIYVASATALAAVQCVDNVRHVREFQRDVDGLPELLATMPRGTRLITLNFSGLDASRAHAPPWIYAASYHRAEQGGVASFTFSELPHWSMQYRPEAAPPRQDDFSWALRPCFYRNARDGAYFDFVLVRGAVNPFRDNPRGPTWKVRGRTAKYALWEKDGGLVPDGPDEGPCQGLDAHAASSQTATPQQSAPTTL